MNDLLVHIQRWIDSKSEIFEAGRYDVSITPLLGDAKKARYIDVVADGLMGRATAWETGELELEALDERTERTVLQKSCVVTTSSQLENELNWWISEINARIQTRI